MQLPVLCATDLAAQRAMDGGNLHKCVAGRDQAESAGVEASESARGGL